VLVHLFTPPRHLTNVYKPFSHPYASWYQQNIGYMEDEPYRWVSARMNKQNVNRSHAHTRRAQIARSRPVYVLSLCGLSLMYVVALCQCQSHDRACLEGEKRRVRKCMCIRVCVYIRTCVCMCVCVCVFNFRRGPQIAPTQLEMLQSLPEFQQAKEEVIAEEQETLKVRGHDQAWDTHTHIHKEREREATQHTYTHT
jgi:hypothetical protein